MKGETLTGRRVRQVTFDRTRLVANFVLWNLTGSDWTWFCMVEERARSVINSASDRETTVEIRWLWFKALTCGSDLVIGR